MNRKKQLLLVLLVAAAFRFTGLDWDQGHAFHPDERRIAFALQEIRFHPLQLNPHFFSYGSFPLYLQKLWTSLAEGLHPEWGNFGGRLWTGRILSALLGVATVGWLFRLGREIYGPRTALVAALLLALSVLPIQHAHFVTVDLYQSAFVVLTLERLVAFARDGRFAQLAAAAAVTGLSLATKVSSAPLLLPLVAAPWLARRDVRSSLGRRAGWTIVALAISGAAFVLGEPYALLDRTAFLHDVREQSAMVREAGIVPYTIQYLGTRPYFDDLWQAFTWGTGPALGLAALAGTVAAILRGLRRRARAEILVLAFFLPYFLLTGSFPVKFMRYLLPLYPLWCLYAARLLAPDEQVLARSTLRKLVLLAVVAGTAGYALAYSSIWIRPHVWVTASRWFYAEIPAGSTVLTPHWEEGFPVSVDGLEPSRYRIRELPLYEADNERKTALLADRLAEGDALVFPSKRLYGAITNAPSRYPKTVRLLELLFAGDLGYRLERSFTSRPALFGFELDDDFADESFTVYDHPKTLIFRKTEQLSEAEIAERLRSRVPSRPIRRTDMIGASAGQAAAPGEMASFVESSGPGALLWITALALLVFSGRRLMARAIPSIPPIALGGLAPAFGYLLFTYLTWLAAALGLAPFEPMTASLIAAGLAALAWRLPRVRSGAGTLVFFGSFAFFLAIRAGNPEIYWGEKPMDFSFLNALYRSSTLPPPEPWMAGKIINYPYFGHFGVAAVGKLARVAPPLAFNLGVATAAALTAAAAFGAGSALTASRSGGFLAALLVAFAGNLAGPFEVYARGTIDFHYFWATSRVIRDTINEFPLWSFLFADLHAHVMAIPLSLLFLGLTTVWLRNRAGSPLLLLASLSLVLGAIATTSTWSFPIYAGALAALAGVAAISDRRPSLLIAVIAMVALGYAWFLPYWHHFTPPPRNWGFEAQGAPFKGVLLIFGGFLFVLLVALASWSRDRAIRRGIRLLFGLALLAAAATSTQAVLSLLTAATAIAAFTSRSSEERFSFSLASCGCALGALADTIFLWDRMNTIFKLYLEMWIFFGVASSLWLKRILTERAPVESATIRWRRRSILAGTAAIGLVSAFTAASDVVGTLRTHRVPGPRPTLNGTAYLDAHHPAEARAIRWLNSNVPGTPVLLEAQGPSYQEFSRISMNTGLPTVLGWEYHLSQRAHAWTEIDRRKLDVAAIFTTRDRAETEQLLDRYRVAMVYVGPIERRTYEAEALRKLDEWTDLFQPIYRSSGVQIYAVTRHFDWSGGTAHPLEDAWLEPAQKIIEAPPPLGRLRQPRGVAVDAQGNVWVADFGNNRIQVFDAQLRPLRAFGRRGEEPGEFRDPCGVAIGPDGLVYVADTWNQRVQVLDPEGRPLRQWGGDFYGPRGIAVGADGSVYVADTGNGRIAKFTTEGSPLARWGKKGSGTGELQEPVGIVIARDGRVLVADAGNRRIVVFSPEGDTLATWAVPGWPEQVFREPYLAFLADGRLVVSDPPGDRLLIFSTDGKVVATHRLEAGANPSGVVVGPAGDLIVAELKVDRLSQVSLP